MKDIIMTGRIFILPLSSYFRLLNSGFVLCNSALYGKIANKLNNSASDIPLRLSAPPLKTGEESINEGYNNDWKNLHFAS